MTTKTKTLKKLIALAMTLTMTVTAFCAMNATSSVSAADPVQTDLAASTKLAGDINGDNVVNMYDLSALFAHCAGNTPLTEEKMNVADYNGDGAVNTSDVQRMYRYISGTLAARPNLSEPSEYEMEVFRLVNIEREKAGVTPLEYATDIQYLADIRVDEVNRCFSHTRPDGRICFSVFDDYDTVDYYPGGENIAWGHRSPEEVVTAWMASSGHRNNVLNPNFRTMIVGCQEDNVYQGRYGWVQLFTY